MYMCATDILHTTYVTHGHIHSLLRCGISILVATLECSIVAASGAAVSRIKGATELAAFASTWFTLCDFFLSLFRLYPTQVLTKVLGLVE